MAGMKRRRLTRKGDWLSRLLFILSLVFLGFGLFNLGWGMWLPPTDAVQLDIPAGVLPGAPPGATYASMADYMLNLSWQKWIRAGEKGMITLHLTEAGEEGSEAVERPAQIVLVEPVIPGVALEPEGRSQANLTAGQDLTLTWEVEGGAPGDYEGKVYVSFGFYDDALGELVDVPVAVVDLAFHVTALYGLEARLVLWLGLVGVVLWGVLFLMGRVAAGR
jgi:hypothetical protein